MLLSRPAILRHIKEGNIVIKPFRKAQLASASYDITLGPNYYREQHHGGGYSTYNPYSANDVKRVWGSKYYIAKTMREWMKTSHMQEVEGIKPTDKVIWIEPGETILGHTGEFIGGQRKVNTMMKARSSFGRNFIEICKDAGWGDIGYINRWTVEITNNSRYYQVPLVVGRRIGQIVFFETEEVSDEDAYPASGKYQTKFNLNQLEKNWKPSMMLPRMFNDYEVKS